MQRNINLILAYKAAPPLLNLDNAGTILSFQPNLLQFQVTQTNKKSPMGPRSTFLTH
jgi:hypothetical protein